MRGTCGIRPPQAGFLARAMHSCCKDRLRLNPPKPSPGGCAEGLLGNHLNLLQGLPNKNPGGAHTAALLGHGRQCSAVLLLCLQYVVQALQQGSASLVAPALCIAFQHHRCTPQAPLVLEALAD